MTVDQPGIKQNITRTNHFVPQGLLRNWSVDGSNVQAYRLLVSHPNVPVWHPQPIKGAAAFRNLYTVSTEDRDSDEFERWIERYFEGPGIAATQKLMVGQRLGPADWDSLVRLYALQVQRTLLSYAEQSARWEKTLPEILEGLLSDITEGTGHFSHLSNKSKRRPSKVAGSEFYNDAFRVKVEREGDGLRIEASISSDRSLWMNSQRQVLSGKALKALHRLKWRIFVPYGDEKWPLTDNPALRLGFRSDSDFSFDGGWGQKKADMLMTLTPRHLMFAEVGSRRAGTETLNLEMTRRLQKVILARAHRVIFATEPDSRIEQERPRVVDAAKFAADREANARWHEGQSEIEREWAARKVIEVSDELLSEG